MIAAGGGTRNPTLMADAPRPALTEVPLLTARTSSGCPPHAKEAYAFALLGFFTLTAWPATVPVVHRGPARQRPRLAHPGPGRLAAVGATSRSGPTQLVVDQDRSSR